MFVVWPGSPNMFHVFTWNRDGAMESQRLEWCGRDLVQASDARRSLNAALENGSNALVIGAADLLRVCRQYASDCATRIAAIQSTEGRDCLCKDKDDHDRHCDAGEQIRHWQATKMSVDAVIAKAEGRG